MARNKYPEITENRILETSMKLFVSKGYENTTIQDITNELGNLSKGAIYHHFKSKEEILDAVSKKMTSQGIGDLKSVAQDNSLTGIEKLRKILFLSISSTKQAIIEKRVPSFQNNPQLLSSYMRDTLGVASDILSDIIKKGMEDGTIPTTHPHELAQMVLLFFNIWVNPIINPCTVDESKRIATFIVEILGKLEIPVFSNEILQEINMLYSLLQNEK